LYYKDSFTIINWDEWARLLAIKEVGHMEDAKLTEMWIDGYIKFSKKLMKKYPFLKKTLPRILKRDFYK